MSKVLEALIAKGRRVRRAAEQKEVAFGLADLSTHEELIERMVQKGGVKSLLLLLTKSLDKDAQRFSSLAIANVSSAPFNRMRVASEGTIPILINIMKDVDSDIITRQYCAMALGNLAAEPENHLEIVKSEGIEALLAVLKTEDVDAGRYAAFGLANIGANANHRDRIVELGGVPSLISLACSEDINAQRQALAGLRSICIAPEFRAVVVREGIMDPLVLLSRIEDNNILREVASAINCLSSVEENKMEISDRAMSTIIGLMLSGDVVIERHAVCAAANLMEMQELHARLTEERGVAPIVAIAASTDTNSRGEACRCLANLSVNPDMHQIVIREGCLAPLVGALTCPELNCQRYSALCLANLATTVAAQVKVIQMGAVKPLIDLGNDPTNQIEARRYAALALANLTATAANHMTIIEDGGLHSFFSLCNSPDLMSQYYVGCALANLSCSIANHYIIVEQGGLQALITLVSSHDPDVHQQAAAALRGLAVTPVNKMKIVQEGALIPLTNLLTSSDVEILREVVACFSNLSVSDENKLEIVKGGSIAAFIALSQSPDMVVASMSCATLANLAEVATNQDMIALEGAIKPTISVMRSKYIEVQREGGRLLANLCASSAESTLGIIESGGHTLLISYLLSQDTACQRVGAMGICNLCTQARFRRVLMENGVVEPLCSLARSDDVELEIQRYAILAIANLASATEIHDMFVKEGMLALLISLSTANDAEVRQYAAYAVTKIAQNAEVRKAVTEEGGLEPVLYLARTDDLEIQKEVLPALCALSFADANKVGICRNGGLEPIVRAIRDGSSNVAKLACCTLANLAEMVENFDRIVDAHAIPPLIQALSEPNDELKRESARALGNLAANIEVGDLILREGALPSLVPMLHSDDPQTQRMGAFALSNLSSNVRNQSFMLAGKIFDILLDEIRGALDPKSRVDYECTRYCLLILSNLAVNVANHPLLMDKALSVLAQFSKHRDIKCRQHAVFCIANLCTNKENLRRIVDIGCLRTIITYAFPSSDVSSNVQFQAISALRGIATDPELRIQIVRDGALEPLIMCAKSNSIEVQREAAATLCNIALAEENKVVLARGGALPALISLAMSGDKQRELHSAAALANIAEMVEGRTQERMIEEGVLKPLLRLADSEDIEIRREVSRAFALFASKRDSHINLIRVHAAMRIMAFLNDIDDTCKRYGVLGLANLAVSRDTHQELFDVGAISKLLEVSHTVTNDILTRRAIAFAFNNISSNPANHIACERLGVIRSIITLLHDVDKDTTLQSTIAIRRLCESARCRSQFLELQGIPVLLVLGFSEDIEIKREVAAALRNLSLSEQCKVAIVKSTSGLGLICDFMHSSDVEVCHQSVGVLANLAEATENQGLMVTYGVLQHIKYVMRSKSIDIQREACRAMANISAEFSFSPAIVAEGSLLSLISAMSSPDFLCQRYAVMGIGNLASNPVNQKKIVQEGGLPSLISLCKFDNGDLESQRYAAIALTNLSATKGNHSVMIDLGCLDLMNTLLHHHDVEIRNTAIFCIANFASNPNNHIIITKLPNCITTMISLLSIDDKDIQLHAVSCIRGLSTDANIRLDLINNNVLSPLLKLSKSDDIEMQMETLATLCNLSLCGCIGDNPLSFLDSISVVSLIAFLCSADSTYRLFGAVALGNIASSTPLQANLLEGGALGPLVTVANSADLETQRCIAYAICNIASDPKRRTDIVREGGLPPIISMSCSEDPADQLAALASLRGIASLPDTRRQVYLANISEAIALGVQSDDDDIKCETASLLCALSINDDNKVDIVNQTDVLLNILKLLVTNTLDGEISTGDPRILRPAIACLANLSEKQECHTILRQQQVHVTILDQFDHEDIALVREAARLISNLSTLHENQPPIVSGGGIQALLKACNRDDAIITRFGVIGLLNLSTLVDNHRELLGHQVYDVLIDVINCSSRTWNHLDDMGNLIHENVSSKNKSIESNDDDNTLSPRMKADESFISMYGYDKESCRYALLAIGNICMSTISHQYFMTETCLSALSRCLTSLDLETRFNSTFSINKLAIEENNLSTLGNISNDIVIIPRLINNLIDESNTSEPLIGQTMSALRHLAMLPMNRLIMLDNNIIISLSTIIEAKNILENKEILRELSSLCCLLSLTTSLRIPMVNSNLLLPLINLTKIDDVEVIRMVCSTIANIAETKGTHKLLSSAASMHIMIFEMKSKHLSIARESSRAVSNMLSSKSFHRIFLDENGLYSLFKLCKSLDIETLYNCALIYRKLSPVLTNHDHIIGKKGLPALQNLTRTSDIQVNLQAAAALRDLASNNNFKTILAEEGCLLRAIELASDLNTQLKILGIGTLRHLAVHTRVKRPIVKEGGLGPLFLGIEDPSQDIDLLRQCSATLALLAENTENQITLIQDGILPRLVFLSNSSNHPEIQSDVAKIYASITSNNENINGVLGNIEVQSILKLTETAHQQSMENCCRDCLVALGNLAISSKNQLLISKLGGIGIIVMCLNSIFETNQRYACRVLYRLASHNEIQLEILHGGAIPLLNKLISYNTNDSRLNNSTISLSLSSSLSSISVNLPAYQPINQNNNNQNSALVKKYALMTLCNISTNELSHSYIADQGSFLPLLQLLSDPDDVITRYTVMTLTNLLIDGNNQILLTKLGILPLLIYLCNQIDNDTSRFAAMALSNLSTNRSNRLPIVNLDGLRPMINMTYSKNIEVQRAASLTLYNLSCAVGNHNNMIKLNIINSLTNLGKVNDLECKKYAIMTLANLSANHETRALATKSGGLQTAIASMKDNDVECRRYACICIGNMTNNLIIQEQVVVHGGLPSILQMISDSSDVESQKVGLLALTNISINEVNSYIFISKNVVKLLLTIYESVDNTVREYVAFILANLCGNPDFLGIIGQSGGIPPLIMLTKSLNVNTVCLSLSALRRLASDDENWGRLIQYGVLDSLASNGYNNEIEIQREVAACLCSLSLSIPHRVEIAYKCISTMVYLSEIGDIEVARHIVGALANLAEDCNTHEYIAKGNGGKCLINLEKHTSSIEIKREVSRGIANLLSSLRHQITIIEDGIPGLLSIINHNNNNTDQIEDEECIYNIALCLRKLTPNIKSHANIVFNSGFQSLFYLLRYSKNINIQKNGAAALRDLLSNPDYQMNCVELGGITEIIGLLKEPDENLQALGLACLRHLSTNNDIKTAIVKEGSRNLIRRILKAIKINNDDIHLQAAGLIANLTEAIPNQMELVNQGIITGLVNLAYSLNNEVQQDSARAFANLCSNEDTHLLMYKQGSLLAMVRLAETTSNDLTQRYASMGLRFLAADSDIRVLIVREGRIDAFVALANSPLLEYQRTAAMAFASFSLHENNKNLMIQFPNCIKALLLLSSYKDLICQRDAVFALSNLCDTLELQDNLVTEGVLVSLRDIGATASDARIQRDIARAFSTLSRSVDIQAHMVKLQCIVTILTLTKSLDIPCQRYATLTICNLCSYEYKINMVNEGVIRPLVFLLRFPDIQIQKYAALAIAGIALGGYNNNKQRVINDGCVKPLIELVRFPSRDLQLSAVTAINAIVLGTETYTKAMVLTEGGLPPLISLIRLSDSIMEITNNSNSKENQYININNLLDSEMITAVIYALGSLAEHDDVITKLVELEIIPIIINIYHIVKSNNSINVYQVDIYRNVSYLLAILCSHIEFHDSLYNWKSFEVIIELASYEDIECQEYIAYSLANLASNKSYQVILTQLGAVRPLVTMLSSDTEPKHYGGLALLKLADNFENHLIIAESGGIQALLRLGRSRSNDEQLQYKAALTVGQLATNAVKLLPASNITTHSYLPRANTTNLPNETVIGTGTRMLNRLRNNRLTNTIATSKSGSELTIDYLNNSIKQRALIANTPLMSRSLTSTTISNHRSSSQGSTNNDPDDSMLRKEESNANNNKKKTVTINIEDNKEISTSIDNNK